MPSQRWLRPVWVPGVLVHVILTIRLIGRRDLFGDEAFSLAATHDLSATLSNTSGTMASYYMLLTPWSWVSPSPSWLRLLSLLAMTSAVAVLALFVQRQVGSVAGRWAGIICACAYLPVRFAVEARSYAVVALLTTLAWYTLDRIMDGDRSTGVRLGYVTCILLLPLTHGLSVIQVVAQLVAVSYSRPSRTALRLVWSAGAASLACSGLLYLAGASAVGNWLDPLSVTELERFVRRMVHPSLWLAIPLLALILGGLASQLRLPTESPTQRFRRVSLALWGPGAIAGLLALSLVRPSQFAQYAMAAAFGLAGLMAVAVTRVKSGTATVILPMLTVLVLLFGQSEFPGRAPTWSAAAQLIDARMEPDDGIIFLPRSARLSFEAALAAQPGLDRPHVVASGRPLGSFDRFSDRASLSEKAAAARGRPRLWVVGTPHLESEEGADALVRREDLQDAFRLARVWHLEGDITIYLFDAR